MHKRPKSRLKLLEQRMLPMLEHHFAKHLQPNRKLGRLLDITKGIFGL